MTKNATKNEAPETETPDDGSVPEGYKPDNFSEPDGNAAFHGNSQTAMPDPKDLPEHFAYEE